MALRSNRLAASRDANTHPDARERPGRHRRWSGGYLLVPNAPFCAFFPRAPHARLVVSKARVRDKRPHLPQQWRASSCLGTLAGYGPALLTRIVGGIMAGGYAIGALLSLLVYRGTKNKLQRSITCKIDGSSP